MSLDLAGEIMNVDDGALDTRFGEPVERMIEKGAPAKLEQGLRRAVRQRTHARAEPRGKHHRGLYRAAPCTIHDPIRPSLERQSRSKLFDLPHRVIRKARMLSGAML